MWRLKKALLCYNKCSKTNKKRPISKEKRVTKKQKAIALIAVSLPILLLVGFFAFFPESLLAQSSFANATVSSILTGIIKGILAVISYLLDTVIAVAGQAIGLLIVVLKAVVRYNGFGTQKEVIVGWKIVRDLINSFYIAIMIAIAISTIIRYQKLNFRSTLPGVIISVFLVNFSRTICLIFINFSTALMVTFADAIGEAWSALTLGLRLPAMTAIDSQSLGSIFSNTGASNTNPLDLLSGIATQAVACVFLYIALAAIFAYVIILIARIIVLWILIILSPLAFFLYSLPVGGKGYFDEWLKKFVQHVLVGPALAFFLFIIVLFFTQNTDTTYGLEIPEGVSNPINSIIGNVRVFTGFLIGLALMFAGLEVADKFSGVKGFGLAKSYGTTLANNAFLRGGSVTRGLANAGARQLYNVPVGTARYVGGKAYGLGAKGVGLGLAGAGAAAGFGTDLLRAKTGVDLNVARVARNTYKGITEGMAKSRKELVDRGDDKSRELVRRSLENGDLLSGFVGAAVTGESDTIKEMFTWKNLKEGFKRSFASEQDPQGKGIQELRDRVQQIKGRSALRGLAETVSPGARSLIGGRDLAGLKSLQGRIASEDTVKAELETSRTDFDGLQVRLNDPSIVSGSEEEQNIVAAMQGLTQTMQNQQQELRDIEGLKEYEQELDQTVSALTDTGVYMNEGQKSETFDQTVERLDRMEGVDRTKREEFTLELDARSKFGQMAVKAGTKDFVSKAMKSRQEAFGDEKKVDIDDIIIRAKGSMTAQNTEDFFGAMHQASLQGVYAPAMERIGSDMGKDFSNSSEGVANLINYMQSDDGLKMASDEIQQFFLKVQGASRDEGKYIDASLVKFKPGSNAVEALSQSEKIAAVKKTLENLSFTKIAKANASGIGVKNSDGDFEIHPGVFEHIKENIGQANTALEDVKRYPDYKLGALRLINERADELGLSDVAKQRLGDFLKKG